MVRYQKDHHSRTQTAIIDAASQLLRDRGFTDTSVGNVMKAVGLTQGSFRGKPKELRLSRRDGLENR
jgi:AcrR family transcriptional regulator